LTIHRRRRRRRRIYSPNLHTKLKPIKNHVMDGYQKGHMAIQAAALKTDNNNINARFFSADPNTI